MTLFPRLGCALALSLALAGCDSGSRTSQAPGTTQSAATSVAATTEAKASATEEADHESQAERLQGRVSGAAAGSEVFLIRPDLSARDLRALADTILEVSETDAAGHFSFPLQDTSGLEILVSAPGKALSRAPWGQAPSLQPEARLELTALDAAGQPLELAFALVLDSEGVPLPVPVAPLVSNERGALEVTRLPAGACEVIVASPDLQQVARLRQTLALGQTYRETLVLDYDEALTRRFLIVAGGPEVARALEAGQEGAQ